MVAVRTRDVSCQFNVGSIMFGRARSVAGQDIGGRSADRPKEEGAELAAQGMQTFFAAQNFESCIRAVGTPENP